MKQIAQTPLLLFAVLTVLPAYADTATLPTRAAGKWQLKTTMDEGRGPRQQVLTMCIDEAMEKTTVQASLREHQANCSKYVIKNKDDRTIVDAVCRYGNADVETRTEMSGDFKSTFAVNIESTTVRPSRDGQSRPVNRTINQTGTYLGKDCGDLKPGQAQGSDGDKVFVQ